MPVAIIIALVIALAAGIGFFAMKGEEAEAPNTDGEAITREMEDGKSEDKMMMDDDDHSDHDHEDGDDHGHDDDAMMEDKKSDAMMEEETPAAPSASAGGTYNDGDYTVTASYFTPKRQEHTMDITLTVKDDTVTEASITYDGGAPASPHHTRFDGGYRGEVVGKKLDDIALSRVGGASLTTNSFNEGLAELKAEAKA